MYMVYQVSACIKNSSSLHIRLHININSHLIQYRRNSVLGIVKNRND